MKKIRHFFEYLAAFLIIFLLLSVITSVVIVKFYGEQVRTYAMEKINEQVDTKITVEEVGISMFRKFPNASVFLNDVTVWSGHHFNRAEFAEVSSDTLFVADRLYLQFNMLDLVRKKYTIKRLEAREGSLRILIDRQGNSNFKMNEHSEASKDARFIELSGVAVRDFDILYINHAKQILTRGRIEDVRFEGNFSDQEYMMKTNGDAYVELFLNHGVTYLAAQKIHTDVSLEVLENHFTISKGILSVGDLSADISGEFQVDKQAGTNLDLRFVGKKIDISWVSDILASSNVTPEGATGRGDVDLSVEVAGLLTPTQSPRINASFSTKRATLETERLPDPLKDLSLEGSYTNGPQMSVQSTTIELESFSVRSGESKISGSLRVENLLQPHFTSKIQGVIAANEINDHIEDLPFLIQNGIIYPDLTLGGSIERIAPDSTTVSISPEGNLKMEGLALSFGDSNLRLKQLKGQVDLSTQKLRAELEGYLLDTDFKLVAVSGNPFHPGASQLKTRFRGSLSSSNVDIDQIQAKFAKDKAGGKGNFPENIDVELEFDFDRITKGGIQTRQVTGTFIYRYPGLYLDPVYLETMNGVINSRIAMLDLNKPAQKISMHSNFRNVEIGNVFKSFNNFGQDFLTHQNIAGSISGESEFLADFDRATGLKTSGIVSENSFVIENGELIDFKPMLELSSFLKIDEMDHIRFSTISNTILINNNTINIPQMDIRSSALNLQASGSHSFDKTFEYHIATKLSEYLFNKAKSSGDAEFNIALDEEDKRTIFLILHDEGEGMMIEFDEARAMKKIRQDLRNEKAELKSLLNTEFGMFKKDSALRDNREEDQSPELRFEFPREDSEDTIQPEQEEKRKWWQRKREPDKKQQFDFVIEDNDL